MLSQVHSEKTASSLKRSNSVYLRIYAINSTLAVLFFTELTHSRNSMTQSLKCSIKQAVFRINSMSG